MLSTLMRRSPAMLRCSTRGATPVVSPLRRGLRSTVTRFREEDRPDTAKTSEQQQQQQQQQQPPKQQQQQQAPSPPQSEQQQQQQQQREEAAGQGGAMARRRPEDLGMGMMGADLMLPPSFRRFNETLNQMQREMDMVVSQFLGDDMLRPLSPFEIELSPLGLPLMPSLPSPRQLAQSLKAPALIHTDLQETDKEYSLTAEVPGFSKDQIKASLSPDGVLTITGELKEDQEDGSKGDKRRMTRFSTFTRSFKLPSDANTEAISASVEHGILHVNVPKTDRKERKHRDIPIN